MRAPLFWSGAPLGENGTSYLITVLAVTYVVHTQQMVPLSELERWSCDRWSD